MSFQRGGILIMTLVFVTMFVVIFTALTGLVTRSYHQAILQAHDEVAFQVAEAGLNYGRWRLSHDKNNLTTETRDVTDQFSGVLGTYTLTLQAPVQGSTIVILTSTGTTAAQPNRQTRVRARYGIPSLAKYSYIVNNDVWYNSVINGPVHANGGVRMDGVSSSVVTSAQSTYSCQTYHGCASPSETKPGVWGSGTNQSLWEFPVAPVDYAGLSLDLTSMKTQAQTTNTYYGPSGVFGYQVIFNANNTYSIYRVTQQAPTVASCDYTTPNPLSWSCGCFSHDIGTQVLLEVKTVPPNGIIYVEDRVWVQGSIDANERVTLAAGVFPDQPSTNADIILNGSITYNGVKDGTRAFGAIAQRHILIPWSGAPSTFTLDGAYIAQKGKFGRRHYLNNGNPSKPLQCADGIDNDGDSKIDYPADTGCSSRNDNSEGTGAGNSLSCSQDNSAHRLKTRIDTYGMLASNLIPGTTWSSGSTVTSGYQQKSQTYDPNLLYNPPPYFPTNGEYQFISWEELLAGEQ